MYKFVFHNTTDQYRIFDELDYNNWVSSIEFPCEFNDMFYDSWDEVKNDLKVVDLTESERDVILKCFDEESLDWRNPMLDSYDDDDFEDEDDDDWDDEDEDY